MLIGEGNGRFLLEASQQISSASVTVVDSSAGMLAAAARRIATVDRCPRIELVHADILEWRSPATNYDWIVTLFFLDLFPPYRIRRIVEEISRLATEDALWINVDFTSENQCLCQKLLMWAQYIFFRISAGSFIRLGDVENDNIGMEPLRPSEGSHPSPNEPTTKNAPASASAVSVSMADWSSASSTRMVADQQHARRFRGVGIGDGGSGSRHLYRRFWKRFTLLELTGTLREIQLPVFKPHRGTLCLRTGH